VSARLSTHVLDTSLGRPAAGVGITVCRIGTNSDAPELLVRAVTNGDGRTEVPLLSDGELTAGLYEITFEVGEYFARTISGRDRPTFLDRVPVRFGADGTEDLHVPLLVTPWSYSTYRGS
jgi:hydroxyisourate hydrolase